MTTRLQILRHLADGKLHSGSDIGRRLGISRAAVAKAIAGLCHNGLTVRAIAGKGYQLNARLTPLDRKRIIAQLAARGASLARIEVLEAVGSTNQHLLAQALAAADPSGMACLAEIQPRGRGRRGKSWIASAYQNLMLSIAWRFAVGPAMVAGLSLAAGVAALRALEEYGLAAKEKSARASETRGAAPEGGKLGLKWPNDILWVAPGVLPPATLAHPWAANDRKLAGLLVDVHGEASGPCTVVLGIGVNCHVNAADAKRIDRPWVDLYTITGTTPDRNRLAALLLYHLQSMLREFGAAGLAPFQAEWNRLHLYANRPVRIAKGDAFVEGTVDGIDASGALRLRTARGQLELFHSGEVSLRAAR